MKVAVVLAKILSLIPNMKQECNHTSRTFSSYISRSTLWPFYFLIMDFIFTVFICNGIIPNI